MQDSEIDCIQLQILDIVRYQLYQEQAAVARLCAGAYKLDCAYGVKIVSGS